MSQWNFAGVRPKVQGYLSAVQVDPLRDVLATQRVNLDGSTLIAPESPEARSLLLSVASSGNFNRQIAEEVPEFVDGPGVYSYARSARTLFVDPVGTSALTDVLKKIGKDIRLTGQAPDIAGMVKDNLSSQVQGLVRSFGLRRDKSRLKRPKLSSQCRKFEDR